MPYCSRCGVEVEDEIKECPLCKTPIQLLGTQEVPELKKYPDEPVSQMAGLSGKEKRRVALEVITVSLLFPLLIVLFTDYVLDLHLTWSRYPVAAILLVWGAAIIPLLLIKRPFFIVMSEAGFIVAFLALVDFLDNWSMDWFYKLALPIMIVIFIVVGVVVFLSIFVKQKGANVAAFILFGIGLMCLGLDLIIESASIDQQIHLSWSVIVFIPVTSLGAFLLYLHYRVRKLVDWKRKFHI